MLYTAARTDKQTNHPKWKKKNQTQTIQTTKKKII